jgi:predicted ArsR family transcriptional regulator
MKGDDMTGQNEGTVNDRIVALLRERGPMSATQIAIALGKNPGSTRTRILILAARGALVRVPHPDNPDWSQDRVPDEAGG